jgi:hypothetical protein
VLNLPVWSPDYSKVRKVVFDFGRGAFWGQRQRI